MENDEAKNETMVQKEKAIDDKESELDKLESVIVIEEDKNKSKKRLREAPVGKKSKANISYCGNFGSTTTNYSVGGEGSFVISGCNIGLSNQQRSNTSNYALGGKGSIVITGLNIDDDNLEEWMEKNQKYRKSRKKE